MSVTRFTLAYPSASNAFQNRLRTEFNNKRAAHFEIDLRFLGEFHFHFSRLWIWPGNVDGMGLSLFFLFEKLDGPRFRNILRLRLRSIWAQSSLSLFRDLSTRRMLLNRSCARRWNDTYVMFLFYRIVGLYRREKTILEWSELRKEVNRDWIYRNRINRIFIYLCTNKAISFEISSDLLEKYRSFLSYQIIRTYIYIENIIRFERWSIHFIGRIIS